MFAGTKAPSVSWLKDDQHAGIRLRHFKVFPYLSPFPIWFGSWVKFLRILNISGCVHADCYYCGMAPERGLLFNRDASRYPFQVLPQL